MSHWHNRLKSVGAGCLKKTTSIRTVVRHIEAANADIKAAEDHPKMIVGIVATEGYIPQ